jgi:AraC-like DNA-binding protein
MKEIFSTAGLHARDRFDCWHEVACKEIVGHHSRAIDKSQFEAHLEAASLAGLNLLIFQNASMDVTRSRQDIAKAQCDDLFVCVQLSGTLCLEQQGRQITLQQNDLCLIDPMVPYKGCFRGASRLLVAKVSRRDMEARVGNACVVNALSLQGSRLGHVTSVFLQALSHSSELPHYQASALKERAIDLVGLSLSAVVGRAGAMVSSGRAIALIKLRSAIEENLTRRQLSPSTAAAAAGMSVRYANVLLEEQGTSLGRLIMSLKLERCRSALENPASANRTITDIALAWGFQDMSHFSRAFRRTYQMSPSQYRRQWQLAEQSDPTLALSKAHWASGQEE